MDGEKVVRLYNRKLYTSRIGILPRDRSDASEVYERMALSEEKMLLDPENRRHIDPKAIIDLLRTISEDWERAGDYERVKDRKGHLYDHAMNSAEILAAKGDDSNENRLLLKMRRDGCISDVGRYKINRSNEYVTKEALKKLREKS
jgi:hypothetical protein